MQHSPHASPSGSPLDPAAHAAFSAFNRAAHAHRQLMMRMLSEHGAHPAQIFCIKTLSSHDGITQRDLAELLHISRPTLTVMLQKMEKAGLIERIADEKDQRYTRIWLTKGGWALHEQIHGVLDAIVEAGLGPMSEADQQELARLLGMFAENIQAAIDTNSPKTEQDKDAS
jgi:MarR family transcriptional regulator, organic hydroperoxide resistance regulator